MEEKELALTLGKKKKDERWWGTEGGGGGLTRRDGTRHCVVVKRKMSEVEATLCLAEMIQMELEDWSAWNNLVMKQRRGFRPTYWFACVILFMHKSSKVVKQEHNNRHLAPPPLPFDAIQFAVLAFMLSCIHEEEENYIVRICIAHYTNYKLTISNQAFHAKCPF